MGIPVVFFASYGDGISYDSGSGGAVEEVFFDRSIDGFLRLVFALVCGFVTCFHGREPFAG